MSLLNSLIFITTLISPAVVLSIQKPIVSQFTKQSRHQAPASKEGLEISAEIKGETFRLHKDDIPLTVTLKNVSQSPIIVCTKWVWDTNSMAFSAIEIDDEKGDWLAPATILERWGEPPLSKADFITIEPGKFIQKKLWVFLDEYQFKRPGTYRLVVYFYSDYKDSEAPAGIKFWDQKHGQIRSMPISFQVIE
jgi:hypothetical protein